MGNCTCSAISRHSSFQEAIGIEGRDQVILLCLIRTAGAFLGLGTMQAHCGELSTLLATGYLNLAIGAPFHPLLLSPARYHPSDWERQNKHLAP